MTEAMITDPMETEETKTRRTLDARQKYQLASCLDVQWDDMSETCCTRAEVADKLTRLLGFVVTVGHLQTAEMAIEREWTGKADPITALTRRVEALEQWRHDMIPNVHGGGDD
jgi:hypothetical protein